MNIPHERPTQRGALRLAALLVLLLVAAISCDAPRDNVLDPHAPDYEPLEPVNNSPTTFYSVRISTSNIAGDGATDNHYEIKTDVNLSDLDGISGVHLEIGDLFRFQMRVKQANSIYTYTLIPGNYGRTVFDFVGEPFYIYVYDNAGDVQRSGKENIVRVIEQIPEILSPTNGEVVGSRPLVEWTENTSPFPITYTLTISRLVQQGSTFIQEFYARETGIPRITAQGDVTDTFTVRQPLPPIPSNVIGTYLLTISTVDNYENVAISKAVGFSIQE